MNESFFAEYLVKWFQPIVQKVTELINGKKKEEQLLHKQMLSDEYSVDLKWGSTTINSSIVSADVVSLDSSIPLKKRASFSRATGDLPKLGIKYKKDEKIINTINVMKAQGVSEQIIAQKIFEDVPKCIKGIDVAKEIMFLKGISSGVTVIEDESNGVGIRVDFGYKAENKFKATEPWGTTGYTPLDDVKKVIDKAQADGNSIACIMISKKYFDLFKNSEQGKVLAMNYLKVPYTSTAKLPTPSNSTFLEALKDELSCDVIIVNSTFRIEKNGVQSSVTPYEEANIVFLYDKNVGRLVYGTLAEETNPVAGVTYQKAGQGILVSKYSKNDPLEEYTMAQELALPVIDGVESIYLLEANKKQEA